MIHVFCSLLEESNVNGHVTRLRLKPLAFGNKHEDNDKKQVSLKNSLNNILKKFTTRKSGQYYKMLKMFGYSNMYSLVLIFSTSSSFDFLISILSERCILLFQLF